ncbi:MAG: hypothetical protein JW860_04060 [Sedimentisphaerales bacterium]|nr:hypothetical protein [Sedimentisphaerales bacterium]
MEYEIEKKFENGPLVVMVKVDKSSISIADTFHLRLEAVIEDGYKLTMPTLTDFLTKEGRLGILDYDILPDRLLDDNKLQMVREYRLEPIVSGEYTIPALKFTFTEESEDTSDTGVTDTSKEPRVYELETEAIPVEVTSLVDEEREKLVIADIKPVASLPRQASWLWAWILGGVILAGTVTVSVLYIVRKRETKQIRIMKAAHEIAYERLRKLTQEQLIEAGRIKEFYERISDILRLYIEHRFDLRAPERTTEEFLTEAGRTQVLTSDHKTMLADFLMHCDLVKFARYGPSTTEIQKTFDLTRNFIEATRLQEKQIDITDQMKAEQQVINQL